MNFLLRKSTRTALFYALGCGLCLLVSRAQRWYLCADWRFAALRELQRPAEGDAQIVFLGSSCTSRGVRPLVVRQELEARGVSVERPVNLAVMGEPRHVNFLQLESYLRDHAAPRVVCIEVGRVDQPDRPHPSLTAFMSPRDAARFVVQAPYRFKDPQAEGRSVRDGEPRGIDAWIAPMDRRGFHVELALEALGRGPEDIVRMLYGRLRNALAPRQELAGPVAERLHGWRNPYWAEEPPIALGTLAHQLEHLGWFRIDSASPSYQQGLEKVSNKAERVPIQRAISGVLPVDLADPRRHRAATIYSRELARLCERHGIRLVFMQLPGFREKDLTPEQVALYEQNGALFRPDLRSLYAVENYADPGHLTDLGAERYSRELAGFLAGVLEP